MKIVLASHNLGKIREFQAYLTSFDIELIPQTDFGIGEIEETGKTFIENALQKARYTAHMTNLPAMADDSGLIVPALCGQPGIYSARYAGKEVSSKDNIQKILHHMQGIPFDKRQAYFYCVIVYLQYPDDPAPLIAQGRWWGIITEQPKGSLGFGYDPIFFVPDENKTAAELTLERKNEISHRGIALQAFVHQISEKIT